MFKGFGCCPSSPRTISWLAAVDHAPRHRGAGCASFVTQCLSGGGVADTLAWQYVVAFYGWLHTFLNVRSLDGLALASNITRASSAGLEARERICLYLAKYGRGRLRSAQALPATSRCQDVNCRRNRSLWVLSFAARQLHQLSQLSPINCHYPSSGVLIPTGATGESLR